jgi:hypothetical protein
MERASEDERIPLGEMAYRVGGGTTWRHLDKLARRGAFETTRAGHVRLVRAADVEAIRAACIAAGYYRGEVPEVAGAR